MVISIANQKGGVGKTTTAVNLSASMAVSEKKTLIIDMDSQCNATSGFGISYNGTYDHIYHVMIGEKDIRDVIKKTDVPFLDIIPAHPDLIGAEVELLDTRGKGVQIEKPSKAFRTLSIYIHRLSAFAWPFNDQLPRGVRLCHYTPAVRIFCP